MIISKTTVGSLAAAAVLSLGFAAGASARAGGRTLAETYPVAATLCVKAHDGTLPARLAANGAKVIAACDTLANAFGPLVSTVDAAEAAYLSIVSTQRQDVASACARPVSDRTTCIDARQAARSADAAARATLTAAIGQFHAAVEQNRATFWTTIASLRAPTGGATGAAGVTP